MIDIYSWSDRNELTKASNNADQAEKAAILQEIAATNVSTIDERIAEDFEDDLLDIAIHDPLSAQIQRDESLEGIMGNTIEEIERRQVLLGKDYPFTLIDGSLRYKSSKTGVYEYCLAISQAPSITTKPFTDLIRYFEILSADAFRAFLGPGTSFVRTGYPSVANINSSPVFKNGFSRLKEITKEWEWDPHSDALGDLSSVKDDGLDFIVWKSMDSRKGTLFITGQCACGMTDWHEKDQDIDANFVKLGRWFRKMCYVKPIRAFSIPHPISGQKIFSTLTERAGLTMDRIRLTKIAESPENSQYFQTEHTAVLAELTKLVIPKLNPN
ncbi:hypothetical protein I7E32_13140 [Alcaligenes faecalis]|uniref:hypothetical protein n=1 Tax=Alcaligenes faecalis TaxID=511 RepID=UPI0018D1DA7B|nr:hypothetical protein [Alcaligenes faecalis]MBH0311309.1 hypothetical protein [Alcaligenes faecalis]